MRLQAPTSSRPVYYDRNPVMITIVFDSIGIVPHSDTIRGAYTVPTGKKAFSESFILWLLRDTAADTPGDANVRFNFTPNGGAAVSLYQNTLDAVQNSIGDNRQIFVGVGALFLVGDLIDLHTIDAGTGGLIAYNGAMKMTEFDE